ncbi:Profilin/allergen [Ascobolus immersus RN42]|uniref:Profilin n=1 Tax=Ascobolus immersus RN42 TaxID=1160509 RepID=A0A3N4I176_ASCIM|nr:Profilin/allergen [Ascobolus immersus RN42]
MSSWQPYVDSSLVGSGKIDKAAIFSAAGDSVWAVTPGFNIKPEEVQSIIGAFSDPSNIRQSGLFVAGEKYIALGCDEESINGKRDKTGLVIVKTKAAIIIGHYPETVQPGEATTVVYKLMDYFKGLGY